MNNLYQKKIPDWIYIFILTLLLVGFATFKITDPDIWLHFRLGEYILKTHSIPKTDIFTYTAFGHPWLAYEWLSAVIFYLIHSLSGLNGIIIFKVLIILLTFLTLWIGALKSFKISPCFLTVIVVLGVMLSSGAFTERARIFTFFFLAILLWLLFSLKEKRLSKKKGAIFIPLLFLLWSNLHLGFLFGLLVIGTFFLGELVSQMLVIIKKGSSQINRRWLTFLLGVFLASIVACLFNPFTYRLLLLPFKILSQRKEMSLITGFLTEYYPIFHPMYKGSMLPFYFEIILFLGVLSFLLRLKNFSPTNFLLFLIFALLPLFATRFLPLFAIVSIPVLASNFSGILAKRKIPLLVQSGVIIILIVFSIQTFTRGVYMGNGVWRKVEVGLFTQRFPQKALKFIKKYRISGNMFNSYRFGEWLIWKGYPVFIDGRSDVCGANLIRDYIKIGWALDNFEELIKNKYRIDYFFLDFGEFGSKKGKKSIHNYLASNPGWSLVYWDDAALIYIKNTKNKNGPKPYKYLNPVLFDATPHIEHIDSLLKEAKRKISEDPKCIIAHSILARLYSQDGKSDSAISEYKKALALNPLPPEAAAIHNNLGSIYQRERKIEEALKEYTISGQFGKIAEPHFNLGLIYEKRGLIEKAMQEYKKAIKIFPDNARAYNRIGILYAKKKRYSAARRAWKTSVAIDPTSPAVNHLRKLKKITSP